MDWTRTLAGRTPRSWAVLAAVAALALAAGAIAAGNAESPPSTTPETLRLRPWAYPGPPQVDSAPPLALVFALFPTPTPSPYDFIWPVDGALVQGIWEKHPSGIDIGAAEGAPVRAVRDGRVAFVGGDPCCGYGLFVMVEHDDGFASLYGHFSETDRRAGDLVRQGDAIGLAGATGKADGPHVHFELHHYGALLNPLHYLQPYRSWTPSAELLAEAAAEEQRAGLAGLAALSDGAGGPVAAGTGDLDVSSAIALALPYLAQQEDAAYDLDAASCGTIRYGRDWLVTCEGTLRGCSGPECYAVRTACVIDQPRIIADACR